MFGWSKGATATALVMGDDQRVRAGLSFDGPMESDPPVTTLDRPFMLMTEEFTRAAEPSVAEVLMQPAGELPVPCEQPQQRLGGVGHEPAGVG
jgi:hypothetical protein